MTIFKVENVKSRFVFGDYEADNEQHALDVYAQDAGYRNFAHAREIAPVEDDEIVATRQTQPTSEAAGYIVFDNNYTIHGYGESVDEAWSVYKETMADAGITVLDEDEDSSEQIGEWTRASGMRVIAASQKLLADIEEQGGDIAWHGVNDVAVTQSEYDESLSQ